MDSILRGLGNVFCFVDDILIASESPESHERDLLQLFQRLNENGVTIALNKCAFFQTSLRFLGFEINENGTAIPKEKTEAILDLKMPTTPAALYALLGHLNYYRRFVKNYATITRGLYVAADHANKRKVKWQEETVEAFQKTKVAVAEATTLTHPIPGAKVAITADASMTGMGAVLEQWDGKTWVPLAFFSTKLNQA